ncbi:hypothetical protein [Novilysobacter spongiicola]|uniref:Tetratricopeptide repeat-containing protein n=1 Tax=Lysobacter spongiicola DSM 21749 TaxID=1122188 RepID=A0A1T4SEP9_9GAMM|nr:hypothetical protein [Lysobacter spongiicola]SKA26790.1 hypothetical protein SAMN02745674_02805 [Lysobacter spongiicola DSM 21749]
MSRATTRTTMLATAVATCLAATACTTRDDVAATQPSVSPPEAALLTTLLDGLGDHSFPIDSDHPQVQRWFDQGLMLAYGFNHDAAERAFVRATELDPECAMCWWGAAYVLGPHVNAGMDPVDNDDAWQRTQKALELVPKADARAQAFIQALAARYADAPPDDRTALDRAWADATRQLTASRPDDLDAAVLHAEALMDLQPWSYYDEQHQPVGHTREIVSTLESVMARNPDHPGALHLYVHAVEASDAPERGAAAADRLRDLVPGSGHLVHMPAHIYARVGRWHDAVIANQRAVEADDAYLALCGANARGVYPLGYVPHNHHFLWFAASMEGASGIARGAATTTAERIIGTGMLREPGFEGLQHYWMTPVFDHVRFGRWEEIAAMPNPAPDLPYVTAIWHYAQGTAAARQGRTDDARAHLSALRPLAADPAMDRMMVWERYPLAHAVRIAERSLTAGLARATGDANKEIAALREAVTIEDRIPYDEPPGWHAPTRHALGAALLDAGEAAQAEVVYREELRRNPGNGWSLQGLARSLEAQGRRREADGATTEFETAWSNADVELVASRF